MFYFAYGSNLSKKQMQERCPGFKPLYRATLPNYKLVFTGWSRQWWGGVATIKASRGDKVKGAVYEGSDKDLQLLDRYEGYPGNYNRMNVIIFDEDGKAIPAVTYIKAGQIEESEPSKDYALIIKQGYIDWGML